MVVFDQKFISESEADYSLVGDKIIKSGGAQSSYNLPNEFFNYVTEKKILIKDPTIEHFRKNRDGDAYVPNSDYKFQLGPGVLWLIGDEYGEGSKFIASVSSTNGKFQIYRAVYNNMADNGYKWFVKLYDKNLSGNQLILDINESEKVFTLDIKFNAIKQTIDPIETESQEEESESEIINIDFSRNRIVFGAPGTGKSYRLEEDRKIFGNNFERVTFHPNYSYSQFVGTYKPVPTSHEDGDGKEVHDITYKYVPGPFMRAYVQAKRSSNPYLLLIEEINRANVTAVFGEVFQLLDRENGESEYEIETSEDMRKHLVKELGGKESDHERMKIPSNMYIWASMNSADQGVFPMDTAFKRRWDFEYIGINENESEIKNIIVNLGQSEQEVNWNQLRKAINNKLSKDCKVNEDKLLGPYFLSKGIIDTSDDEKHLKNNKAFLDAFKSKVIMYLYEDAGKQYKQKLFAGCSDYSKYSLVCDEFDKKGEKIFGDDILSYADNE
ncbi:AAA family ATPase [Methanobrevibacter ruminantium]|uniref:AAA family ATPase n=1 Tax=Methanobrevibacter ruminantium TaxID=83816 RepID=UPI0026ECC008|nr:AAA family ATPase [Methanobrevibacter ruminantium]